MQKKFSHTILTMVSFIIWNIVLVATIFASFYITSFNLKVELKGPTRQFDGKNIAFEASIAKSTPWPHSINKTYSVTLYRDNGWWGTDKISEIVLPRDSQGTAQWPGIGSGNYFFYLEKENDGIELIDKDVKIYNY